MRFFSKSHLFAFYCIPLRISRVQISWTCEFNLSVDFAADCAVDSLAISALYKVKIYSISTTGQVWYLKILNVLGFLGANLPVHVDCTGILLNISAFLQSLLTLHCKITCVYAPIIGMLLYFFTCVMHQITLKKKKKKCTMCLNAYSHRKQ